MQIKMYSHPLALSLAFALAIVSPQTCAQSLSAIRRADYATNGNPSTALPTSDGQYIFLSVTNVGGPNYSTPDVEAGSRRGVVSGVQIFRRNGDELEPWRFIRVGSKGANGMTFLPGEKTIAIAAGDEGVVFLDVHASISGDVKPYILSQGEGAGTWDVVASPTGRYLFAANEYGHFQLQRGNIGIISIELMPDGRLHQARTIRRIPAGNKVPRMALSPDGTRLYAVREILPHAAVSKFAGKANPILTKHDCVQVKGIPPHSNGLLTVVDISRAVMLHSGEDSILSEVASGCSPVNVIETRDGKSLYVAARGDNRILHFSSALLEADPEHAFLGAFESGGDAPVGLRLLPDEKTLLVTNSNRFGNQEGSISLIDVSSGFEPTLVQRVPAGEFPRNITVAPDGKTVFITNYTSRSLEILTLP